MDKAIEYLGNFEEQFSVQIFWTEKKIVTAS